MAHLYPIVTDHWVPASGGRLYARRWQPPHAAPDLPALVLLHDSLGCVALWRDFPADLMQATGWPVLAYDRLGFGRSDPHPSVLALDFIDAESTHGFQAVVNHLEVATFVALGHSVGGGMAIGVAATHPQRCLGYITLSAQAFVEDQTLAGIRDAQHAFATPAAAARLERHHGPKAQWVLDAWIQNWLNPSFADWSVASSLERVRCPGLLLHGDQDPYGSMRHPAFIAAHARGPLHSEHLHGVGHVPHRECPQRVLEIISRWIHREVHPQRLPSDPV